MRTDAYHQVLRSMFTGKCNMVSHRPALEPDRPCSALCKRTRTCHKNCQIDPGPGLVIQGYVKLPMHACCCRPC